MHTLMIGLVLVATSCSNKDRDVASKPDKQGDAEKTAHDDGRRTIRDLDKRLQAAYGAMKDARKPAPCAEPPPGSVPVIDADLLKFLAINEPTMRFRDEYGGREDDDVIDDFRRLSSPVFTSLRDDREADLQLERGKKRSAYDESRDGEYSFDNKKRVATMAAAANTALGHKHLLVLDYTTKETTRVSEGAGIGIFTPGKLAGRVLVVDLDAARVDCAAPIKSTNTDGVEKLGLDSLDPDLARNAYASVAKALKLEPAKLIRPTL